MVSTWNFPRGGGQGSCAARRSQHGTPGESFSIAVCLEDTLSTESISDDLTAGCVIGGSESKRRRSVCFGAVYVWKTQKETFWMVNCT